MNIAQLKKDFDNGVLISRATLGKLIDYAQLGAQVMSRDSYISGGSIFVEGYHVLSGHRLEYVKIYISKNTLPDSFANCYLVCCDITYEDGSIGQRAFNNCIFSDEPLQQVPVTWLTRCIDSGLHEEAGPNEKATNPKHWTDAFPVYAHPAPTDKTVGTIPAPTDERKLVDTQKVMTPKAMGLTYDKFIGVGWTDTELVAHGYMQATDEHECTPMLSAQPLPIEQIHEMADNVVACAERSGFVVSIHQVALKPLAMGNYKSVVSVRPVR